MAEEKDKDTLTGEIKDVSLDYQKQKKMPVELTEEQKKEMEKTQKELDNLKKKILKKYKFTMAIGILPPQTAEKIEEEENVPIEEVKKKPIHLLFLIPEEQFKNINKIKADLIKETDNMKPKVWIHIKTPVDIWNYALDGKYEIVSAFGMSFPLYDRGFLGALRLAEIHKSLVLRKFEKYVSSYFIAGSFIRGDATKTSDVDIYIIIDDTDVKRMPRLELKEKLRSIIYQYEFEARELAGVKNHLHIQTYILTEFWESVKDAHPVIFTIIRDGVPLYDRGTFMPWKLLLKMGKLKPSPEAIDMFMSMGDKVSKRVQTTFTDLVITDIYWGVITPAQALLMLYGLPPPTTKETSKIFRETFVEKEKLLEAKYANILEKIIKTYKDFEHKRIKDGDIKGKDVDEHLKDAEDFLKRLKELRKQIEKKTQEKTIEEIYKHVFEMLTGIFGKKSETALIYDFEREFIKKGSLPSLHLKTLKNVAKAKKEYKKGNMKRDEVEEIRKDTDVLINRLIDYSQRSDLISLQKGKLRLKTKTKIYELILTDKNAFLIDKGKINKINIKSAKLENSNIEELNEAVSQQKKKTELVVDEDLFSFLKKKLGKFDIII